ncbi:HD domain-containing protein [Salibacterium lacus]|uniref:HD domain-containing protein n=1 Tax=Salibacterium lacus TaxID=1898109 RepID=A0ABW5T1R8_9BACI
MNTSWILEQAKKEAVSFFEKTGPSHDYWHTERVVSQAVYLAKEENADAFVCELSAWLHDIADEKVNESEEKGRRNVQQWLTKHVDDQETENQVMDIIGTMSFRNGEQAVMRTLEGQVVQDADRLDAVGAIGIARTFAHAGEIGETLHRPDLPGAEKHNTAIGHFYNKLLRLKSLMNTRTAADIASKRQKFMINYLEQFYSEWEHKA